MKKRNVNFDVDELNFRVDYTGDELTNSLSFYTANSSWEVHPDDTFTVKKRNRLINNNYIHRRKMKKIRNIDESF